MIREKLGFRDLHFNLRHRDYGDCPGGDIDFVESIVGKNGRPILNIELKRAFNGTLNLNDPEFDRFFNNSKCHNCNCEVPAIVLVYMIHSGMRQLGFEDSIKNYLQHNNKFNEESAKRQITHVQFIAAPINRAGMFHIPIKTKMTELDYVSLLYKLRGLKIPESLAKNLYSDFIPCSEASIQIISRDIY